MLLSGVTGTGKELLAHAIHGASTRAARPLVLQGKLLRVLQEKEFEPLGSNRIVRTNVRIIAATSADLPALVYAMLEELSADARPRHAGQFVLHDGALRLLSAYSWPGNVRELRNVLERAVMLSDNEHIGARTLGAFMGAASVAVSPESASMPGTPGATSWAEAMAGFEKRFLSEALRAIGGRVAEAAQRIGIGRAMMYKKIVELDIEV